MSVAKKTEGKLRERDFPGVACDEINLMFAYRENTLHLVHFMISCVQNQNKG